jgi:SAM-dependent methyltransferase
VIAFDPALELMQLAKRHAIASGVYLEYICSDMANFRVVSESVDAVFALHSLHHVPDIDGALRDIHQMLRIEGCLAVDDHLQDVRRNLDLRYGMILEAEESIFPAYRNEQAALVLPSHHSENEGVGMGEVLQTTERYLYVDEVRYRHINLDLLGPLAFLKFNRSKEAVAYAVELADFLHKAMLRAWPDTVEYMTFVAQKRKCLPGRPVFSPPPSAQEDLLKERLIEYEQELKRLHAVVEEKNAHIARLERLLHRIENGRVMRILRWASRQ